ncbi:MAG: hypothetical protein A3B70_04645 [Deltaproteobacteria bacterium RIFCSPHIGHO2_02_FULL_40_11]|nr:MAG: hypothetical protein A3B70_04645 [Deltaproteobacteria bacterium RIFCSPHIGHO2_02_FULL_40_11]
MATRIQARALFLSNIAILDRAQQKRLVGLQVRDTLPKRAHGRYMQTLRMEYKRLEGWKIGDSWKSTLREDAKRKTLNIMKQEVAEKVSKIEAQANRRLLRAKVLRGGAKFLSFGARGMRYVLGPLAIAFGATEMIRLLTSEASNSELTAEDRLLDFEKSVRTYRHDPESIGNQKALVEASAASLPDIISAVEHKVDVQKEVLSDIEKSEDLSAEDKEVFKHAAEIELGQAKKSLKSHQAALDLITSGNDASDESLEKLKIQTEKFLQ